jgi:hypothetical protein
VETIPKVLKFRYRRTAIRRGCFAGCKCVNSGAEPPWGEVALWRTETGQFRWVRAGLGIAFLLIALGVLLVWAGESSLEYAWHDLWFSYRSTAPEQLPVISLLGAWAAVIGALTGLVSACAALVNAATKLYRSIRPVGAAAKVSRAQRAQKVSRPVQKS